MTASTMMRSATVRTVFLVVLCLPLLGLDDVPNPTVHILPHWKKGERIGLEITRTREKSVEGTSAVMGKTHTPFTLEVLSVTDEEYLIGWTAGATRFESPAPAAESFLRQVTDLMKGSQIELQVDRQGRITGVRNWKALKVSAQKAMDSLFAATLDSPQGKVDRVLMAKLRKQWDSMFVTRTQVEQLCTREARIYFHVLGRDFSQNRPYEYDALLPNPLGGEDFPAHARMALKTFDKQSGQAVITWDQTADPQQAAKVLESTITSMTAGQGPTRPEATFPKTIALTDHAAIVVDVATGWVQSLTQSRSLHLGTRTQVDTTSILRTAE